MKTIPNGLIVIQHEVLESISDLEIIDALSDDFKTLPRHTVSIQPKSFKLGEAMQQHWPSLLAEQERLFEEQLAPKLAEYPTYEVLYFGLAPIPLAIHLGYKLGSLRGVQVFLKDHMNKNWKWRPVQAGTPLVHTAPTELNKAQGEVVIRFGTRFEIHQEDTEQVVPAAMKDIAIAPLKRGGDIFGSHEQITEYAKAFFEVLDAIKSNLPNTRAVHLFAAVPVGLAFLLGQEINPNAHPPVHIYEYDGNREPAYAHVFTANEALDIAVFDISSDERVRFKKLREDLLADIQEFENEVIIQLGEADDHWFKALSPSEDFLNPFDQDYWNSLVRLDRIPVDHVFLTLPNASEEVLDQYHFSDAFLKSLTSTIQDQKDLNLVARLYAFRQSILQAVHKVLPKSVHKSARYPRIIEEANYQADVYAMLNEFFLEGIHHGEPSDYFSRMIDALTETMWAFDKVKGRIDEMEVQRVNRYLTWYYIAGIIEQGDGLSLEDILALIARKPIIELRLQATQASASGGLAFKFKQFNTTSIGIAIFHDGKMVSRGNEEGELPLTDLIEGFKQREPTKIKQVLNALRAKI